MYSAIMLLALTNCQTCEVCAAQAQTPAQAVASGNCGQSRSRFARLFNRGEKHGRDSRRAKRAERRKANTPIIRRTR